MSGVRVRLVAFGEMLPQYENYVEIDKEGGKDSSGVPVLRIDCRHGENETAMARDMASSGLELTWSFWKRPAPRISVTPLVSSDDAMTRLTRCSHCSPVPPINQPKATDCSIPPDLQPVRWVPLVKLPPVVDFAMSFD
jgi:hypothetical protein